MAPKARHLVVFAALGVACGSGGPGGGVEDVLDASDVAEEVGTDSETGVDDTGADTREDVETSDDADADADTDVVPDSSPIEFRTQAEPASADAPYRSEETRRYFVPDLGAAPVPSAVHVVAGSVWVATSAGVHRYDPEADAFEVYGLGDDAISAFDAREGEAPRVVAGTGTRVVELQGDAVAREHTATSDVTDVAFAGDDVIFIAGGSVWRWGEGEPVAVEGASGRRVAAHGLVALVAGDEGVWRIGAGGGVTSVTDVEATDVAVCPDGAVVVATEWEIGVLSGDSWTWIEPGRGGLPTDGTRSVACGADWIVLGHDVGASAIAREGGHIDHYQSGRWLLDDAVSDVAVDGFTRWFATPGGVTRVDGVPRTLQEKATLFMERHDDWFWRLDGFSAAWARTDTPWSWEGLRLTDDDNDGQWTQEMIAALVFAAGATGEDAWCDRARPAVRNMLMLFDMPCATFEAAGMSCGYVTRSFVREDEGALYDSKATQPNWHAVEYDGAGYYWKDNTSSDEYAGHYFGLPLFFDVCATEEEQAEIGAALARATDYLIENDYSLIDLDGQPTDDGVWSKLEVAGCVDGFASCPGGVEECASACFGGGFTNGAEILGHLLATWHVTGDAAYYEEYLRLRDDERYGEVVVFDDSVLTALNPVIENHVDHELGMLAFHTLIRYEPDPEWRARWTEALIGLYETELDEENPLWAAIVAGVTGQERDRAAAIESLREYPVDTRWWRFDHTHRLDVEIRSEPDRFGEPQLAEWPPPYDEQPVRWWDQSPYAVIRDGDGRSMRGQMAYLIAYWSMRYYGLLAAAD